MKRLPLATSALEPPRTPLKPVRVKEDGTSVRPSVAAAARTSASLMPCGVAAAAVAAVAAGAAVAAAACPSGDRA
eukprot:scaffold36047_cov56-Phaeocystis_antarctica.AAC.1